MGIETPIAAGLAALSLGLDSPRIPALPPEEPGSPFSIEPLQTWNRFDGVYVSGRICTRERSAEMIGRDFARYGNGAISERVIRQTARDCSYFPLFPGYIVHNGDSFRGPDGKMAQVIGLSPDRRGEPQAFTLVPIDDY